MAFLMGEISIDYNYCYYRYIQHASFLIHLNKTLRLTLIGKFLIF